MMGESRRLRRDAILRERGRRKAAVADLMGQLPMGWPPFSLDEEAASA